MKTIKIAYILVALVIMLSLAGCGGSGGAAPAQIGDGQLKQMGGAVQGRSLSLSNTVTTIAGKRWSDGTGAAASFSDPRGVTTDGINLYVADMGNNTIRKIVIATGAVTTMAGMPGNAGAADGIGAVARFNSPADITTDGTNLYVADSQNYTIRKVVIATGAVTTLAGTAGIHGSVDGIGAAASFYNPSGITTDGADLYIVDSGNSTIRKVAIATGAVTTLAGTAGITGSADGIRSEARFNYPGGISTEGTNLYVADTFNGAIRKIVIATGAVSTLAGAAAGINAPSGVAIDGANLYVADLFDIKKVVIATGQVSTLAGTGAWGAADGVGTAASFYFPQAIASDGTNLYIADSGNNIIRKIVTATGAVTTLAGVANGDGSDGIGNSARFLYPNGITTNGTNLYVADYLNSTIRTMAIASGEVTTLAGTTGTLGSADGIGPAATFSGPGGITTDGTNLYLTDVNNHLIRKVMIATGAVTTLAGTAGVVGSTDGTGVAARFDRPCGITTDGLNLYVTDTDNGTIRKIVIATGVVTTLAGTAKTFGWADGAGAEAIFYRPFGITTDGKNLYVTDFNRTIRKVDIASQTVTTLAGSASSAGSIDGIGAVANFREPRGVTTDGTNLYVTDTCSYPSNICNNTVRQINISTGVVSTIAGTAGTEGTKDGVGPAAEFTFPKGITTDGTYLYLTDGYGTIRRIQ